MNPVSKKIVVDEYGQPVEVIVPWESFCEIAETMGWDLDEEAKADLRETRSDLESGNKEAFVQLSSL